jgi:hypothetical protein
MLQQNALALDSDISSDSEHHIPEDAAINQMEQSSIISGNQIEEDEESLAEIYEILLRK